MRVARLRLCQFRAGSAAVGGLDEHGAGFVLDAAAARLGALSPRRKARHGAVYWAEGNFARHIARQHRAILAIELRPNQDVTDLLLHKATAAAGAAGHVKPVRRNYAVDRTGHLIAHLRHGAVATLSAAIFRSNDNSAHLCLFTTATIRVAARPTRPGRLLAVHRARINVTRPFGGQIGASRATIGHCAGHRTRLRLNAAAARLGASGPTRPVRH